jgi:hypothetical protein
MFAPGPQRRAVRREGRPRWRLRTHRRRGSRRVRGRRRGSPWPSLRHFAPCQHLGGPHGVEPHGRARLLHVRPRLGCGRALDCRQAPTAPQCERSRRDRDSPLEASPGDTGVESAAGRDDRSAPWTDDAPRVLPTLGYNNWYSVERHVTACPELGDTPTGNRMAPGGRSLALCGNVGQTLDRERSSRIPTTGCSPSRDDA